ncbi:hypothetical protein LACDD01_02087 [Lactococcus sp. DD01]|nr:hypothetical protein LACDD01_02087 [Lactococcus sp. DD01]
MVSEYKKLRNNIGINGLISSIFGLFILYYLHLPGRTAQIGTVLIGIAYLVSIEIVSGLSTV